MMKKCNIYFHGCVLMVLLFSININCIAQEWIKFDWSGFKMGERYFKYGAMNVPFKFDSLPFQFYAQFDLGATSQVELDIIEAFKDNTPIVPFELKKSAIYNDKVFFNAGFKLDSVHFIIEELVYKPNNNFNWKNIDKPIRIGTIGADICVDKTLIIDYQNQRMAIMDELSPEYLGKIDFIDCRIDGYNRIIFPLTIGDTIHEVLFDTGSSSWELVTRKRDWENLSAHELIDSIQVSSWGEQHYMIGGKLLQEIFTGNKKLTDNSSKCYYTDKSNIDIIYDKLNIFGIVGNALFLEDILIIDFKNKKIGVLN